MRNVLGLFVLAIMIVFAIYWNDNVSSKIEYLKKTAEPFQNSCRARSACVIVPHGWKPFSKNSYYNPASEFPIDYRANEEEFEMNWKIAPGITLIATGGRNKVLEVKKHID